MSLFFKLTKLVRLRFGLPYVRLADRARDRGEWIDAVIAYRKAVAWLSWREDLKVQIGNSLKECGDYNGAIKAYVSVSEGPSLFEARRQILDVNRRAGTSMLPFAITEGPSAESADIVPGDVPPITEALHPNRSRAGTGVSRLWLGTLGQEGHGSSRLRGAGYATIKLDQIGSMMVERDGVREPLLAGIVAVRGRVSSLGALDRVEIRIGDAGSDGAYLGTFPITRVEARGPLNLYVFNAWIDTSRIASGRWWLAVDVGSKVPALGLHVTVGRVEREGLFESSNSFVALPVDTGGADNVEARVLAAPVSVREARRSLFDHPVSTILALRVDQLGDVSASLAALRRLRALFPEAKIAVLAQPMTRPVILATGLVDEVIEIELSYSHHSERRFLDPREEERLQTLLGEQRFDLAIDLSPGDESRPLLLLSGATYLVGFNPDRFAFLDFGISVRSRDKVNQLEKISHAAVVAMLVEALAVALEPARQAVVRAAPSAANALPAPPGRYVVLHMGARHAINQWPAEHFLRLAERITAETDYQVAIFGSELANIPPDSGIHRYGMIDPDAFDSIVSHARALVGNDSGPKHLAAAHGVPTISIHVDRLNWNEWGQDGSGTIVSRRVPCAGCGLNDISLCGREAVCVTSIGVDTIFEALRTYL